MSGIRIEDYCDLARRLTDEVTPIDKEALLVYVQKSGGQVIARKGATYYAVSTAVCNLCRALLSADDSVITISSLMHGEYGVSDVALSTLTLVGPDGVKGKIETPLTAEEVQQLHNSANALKKVIAQIEL